MRKFYHPITKDEISFTERVSWVAQSIIRRWTFLIVYTVVTMIWWTHPAFFGDAPDQHKWNELASFLAIVLESTVGIGVFYSSVRDATILREVRDVLTKLEKIEKHNEQMLKQLAPIPKPRGRPSNARTK